MLSCSRGCSGGNTLEDEKEEFESKRNMTEYLASFIEPEAVRQIVAARDRAVEVQDDVFLGAIKQIGGRDINISKEKNANGQMHAVDPRAAMQNYKAMQQGNKQPQTSYKDWMNVELD